MGISKRTKALDLIAAIKSILSSTLVVFGWKEKRRRM